MAVGTDADASPAARMANDTGFAPAEPHVTYGSPIVTRKTLAERLRRILARRHPMGAHTVQIVESSPGVDLVSDNAAVEALLASDAAELATWGKNVDDGLWYR
jgi:hypothetical protein